MTSRASIQDDLQYVAGAVRKRQHQPGVPVIFFLWAAIILVGWALPDFAPDHVGLFWLTAGPVGGLTSWWLGARHARASGDVDKALAMRHGLHWLVAGVAFFAVFLPIIVGAPEASGSGAVVGRQILLLVALAYGLAAVHLERGLAWPAALMAAGYVTLTLWSPPYLWTSLGVIVAATLVAAGLQARR